MATIRERRPGVFEVREYVGRDAKGRPKQVSRIVHGTLKDARRLASELTVRPSSPEGSSTTLGELLDLWVEANGPFWAPSSAENQRSRVRLAQRDPICQLPVAKVTTLEIDRWHVRMARQGLGEASIRNRHLVVRAALTLAVRWAWVPANAAAGVRLGRRKRVPRGAMRPEQVRSVLEAAHGLAERGLFEPHAPVGLRLAAVTGARRGELAALRWEELEGDLLTVDSSIAIVRDGTRHPELRDDPTKTANRRVVRLDPVTCEQLAALRERCCIGGPWILAVDVQPLGPERLSAWWRRARDLAGVDACWRLHDLRHWAATASIAAGHDVRSVAGRLGHANPAMTLRVYAHAVTANDRAVADTLAGLLDS